MNATPFIRILSSFKEYFRQLKSPCWRQYLGEKVFRCARESNEGAMQLR